MADIDKNVKKILCIDDDATMLKVIHQILSKSFRSDVLEIYEAKDGDEGLQKIHDIQPNIILSDIQMPGKDGFEICKSIRDHGIPTAIILMSAYDAQEDNAIKARDAGADAYLSKPVKKGELLFVVGFVLRIASLNEAVTTKNAQLEQSLDQLKQYHQKLTVLNEELKEDKRRLNDNLKEMVDLNNQLESKNSQILAMNNELSKRFDSTVSLLGNIIELHQSKHRGHAERVAEMSVFIAEKMGLTEQQVHHVKTGAQLHELGIVSLPTEDRVEEAVDETKSRMYTNHPLVGEMLLKAFPGFEIVSNFIRHLHENVNGSGIPDGLTGDQIPIGSRIISACSYYDHTVMANPKMKQDKILEQLENESGILFDERVVSLVGEYVSLKMPEEGGKSVDVSVFALKPGMRLASDIYSESGINLLRKGTVLEKELLNRILKFHNVDPIVGTVRIRQG